MKQTHRMTNVKLVQILPNKNNADEDCFVLVPKSCVPKGPRGKVARDPFGPADLDRLARQPEISRSLVKCALCDFSTKVRRNLMRHLALHQSRAAAAAEVRTGLAAVTEARTALAVVAPINPPAALDNGPDSSYSRLDG